MLVIATTLSFTSFQFFASRTQAQTDSVVRLELPANGNLRVENLRGAVILDVGDEPYISVAAVSENGEKIPSPAVIQSSASLLSVRVARADKSARVHLTLRVPAKTHAAIFTADGSVEVRSLPRALLVQTVSGEVRIDVPGGSNATVVAESKTGNVTSSVDSLSVDQAQRPQLRGRLGNGANSIRVFDMQRIVDRRVLHVGRNSPDADALGNGTGAGGFQCAVAHVLIQAAAGRIGQHATNRLALGLQVLAMVE